MTRAGLYMAVLALGVTAARSGDQPTAAQVLALAVAPPTHASAVAYLAGLTDAMDGRDACPPDGFGGEDGPAALRAWLERHPKAVDAPAPRVWRAALEKRFPCKAKTVPPLH